MIFSFTQRIFSYYKFNGLRPTLAAVKRNILKIPYRSNKIEINQDSILNNVRGVIHVGANHGSERHKYDAYDLNVIWIEPIPEIFDQLQSNIANYEKQIAFNYLVTDRKGEEYNFNVASNNGASSSIFEFKEHKKLWPSVNYRNSIKLRSTTLKEMVRDSKIELENFEYLVMDTQGSELLVLKGAGDLVERFKYITTEAADFESYKGGCFDHEITEYLEGFGFREIRREEFAKAEGGGTYYDITYQREE